MVGARRRRGRRARRALARRPAGPPPRVRAALALCGRPACRRRGARSPARSLSGSVGFPHAADPAQPRRIRTYSRRRSTARTRVAPLPERGVGDADASADQHRAARRTGHRANGVLGRGSRPSLGSGRAHDQSSHPETGWVRQPAVPSRRRADGTVDCTRSRARRSAPRRRGPAPCPGR